MIIALFTNIAKNHAKAMAIGIREYLHTRDVKVVTEDSKAPIIGCEPLSKVDPEAVDFILSLGGDGTILRIFHTHPNLDAPILGINLGGLGFMADIAIEEVYPSLDNLLAGRYQIQNRLMMEGVTANGQNCFAINEIVIHRAQNPALIDLALFVDGNYLNTFSADGMIIATPNGSTAYSLAAGGPILSPNLFAFVLTPICPHTISNRPLVLMPKEEIQVRYTSEYPAVEITYDGFSHFPMHTDELFRITPSKRVFRLVTMQDYDYFSTVRSKLGWAGKLKK